MKDGTQKAERNLAKIESDLLNAEEVFSDADIRLKEAERDRRAALDAISKHQAELDEAITALRQQSVAGSRWQLETNETPDVLLLQAEDMIDEPVLKAAVGRRR